MTDSDFDSFSEIWASAWELFGKTPPDRSLMTAFDSLKDYSISDVTTAITAHLRDPDAGRFPPKPADIIGKMIVGINDGRPGSEEAWAMCPMSERETAWMTAEMSAAQASCATLIERGDTIAARKTFLEVYDRAVKSARILGIPCSWAKSLGWDASGREAPVNESVARKYLEHAAANLIVAVRGNHE